MAVLIEMPLAIYQGFLGRCPLASREYEILRNSVVNDTPLYLRVGSVVEFLCEIDDAKLILTRAKLFYPVAVSYIEEGIRIAGKPTSGASQIEYRKTVTGDTWHFCSSCSQWPTADFLSSDDVPDNSAVCNECVVKAQLASD